MEDSYVKPGNEERGWNDPPQFSYGLQMTRRPQRNLLNKRATPPVASGAGAPSMVPATSDPLAPPPSGVTPPPRHPARPPPPVCAATPPPPSGPITKQRVAESSQSEREPDVDGVVLVLNRALAACRQAVKDQVCNDVAKRLRLLEDSWRSGRLSLRVRRRMDTLSLELQAGHWDSADEIHRSLMVDHVTEVSQWMVGVKRLIAETRKLSPQLLEALQKPTDLVQDSAEPVHGEPVQDSAEPVHGEPVHGEPVQDSAELVHAESVQDSAEPAHAEPVHGEPVQDSAELVQAESVQDSAEPDHAEPVQDSAELIQAESVQDSAEPDHGEPVQDSAELVQNPASQS